ncbi:hypothetical protein GS501_04910 [Saccharibacter sp. 17.LH.SD]|uniref:hypothetical protein n=1 Tax=Saccharibacter sp. 17.LH.SD TaxID=2689393 RepID=UPI00136AD6BD|nr:hypothetical protein [Saccharibacter sp. 17.LH.SD]MXV44387.1 hypothetical protein [Saccharibacter sp. 17.LH.SD]
MKLVSQSPIVPGEASTATFLGQDENGNVTSVNVKLPPGKAATLPPNLATTDMLSEFVSGTLNLTSQSLPALGAHWDGGDYPTLLYGSFSQIYSSNLLGSNASNLYLTNMGNVVPEMPTKRRTLVQNFLAENIQDGDTIPFPRYYTSDDVMVFITPKTPSSSGSWSPPLCGVTHTNRYGFGLSRFYTDGTSANVPGEIAILAIGSID